MFSEGGPHVARGEIACISAYDVMHNETKFPRPNEFDGLRFVKGQSTASAGNALHQGFGMRGTTFIDASKDFPIWGFGSRVW